MIRSNLSLFEVYFLIRQPVVSFLVFFPPFLLVTAAASGLGYMISTTFPPKHGPFITATWSLPHTCLINFALTLLPV